MQRKDLKSLETKTTKQYNKKRKLNMPHKKQRKTKETTRNNHFCVIHKNASENEWKHFYILDFQWHNQKILFYFFCLLFRGAPMMMVMVMLLLLLLLNHSILPQHLTISFFSAIKYEHFGRLLGNSSPFFSFICSSCGMHLSIWVP